MPNAENLRPKPFTKENQPAKRGRTKGVPNRATVYKRILGLQIEIKDPENPGEKIKLPLYEAMALGQAKSAMKGNTQAWKEIQDSLHGKQVEKSEVDLNVGKIEVVFKKAGSV
jgi:hypothetical protein